MKLNAAGVGLRIRQARIAKGWTQAQLADRLGIQRSSVVRWENGVSVPSRFGVPKLAQVLEHSADWLLAKADEGTAPMATNGSCDLLELKRLRSEIRRLKTELNRQNKSRKIPRRPDDDGVLSDILVKWPRANKESRLLAALLITGDWSYKLKLWNRDIAVGDDVLKAIASAHRKTSA